MGSTPTFTTDRLRNVVLLGHGGAGKTTLVDACCFTAGSSRRRGSVEEGTALTMSTPEEISHGISMNCSVAHAEWRGRKINFIDTPGYLDFAGETAAGVRAADGALIVVSALDGVEVGTERAWDLRTRHTMPTMVFVGMMDRPNADFEKAFADLKGRLTRNVIPVEIPIGSGTDFRGIVNLFTGKAHIYLPGTERGEYEEVDVPEEFEDLADIYRAELIESIAATDDRLLELYFSGEEITEEEVVHAMKRGMLEGELVPLFCGAASVTYGIRALMTGLVELMPSPQERPPVLARGRGDSIVELRNLNSDPFCALVFKTTSEPHVGELSYFRILGGSVKNGDEVFNAERDSAEKLSHLSIALGRERLEVDELRAGDIGVVAKLRDTHTNDSLSMRALPITAEKINFPIPDMAVALEVEKRGDEEKLSHALQMLHEEDPCFVAEYDAQLGQTIGRGRGDLHLQVQVERMRRKYNVGVTTSEPKIPYQETIRSSAEAHGRHKKQTGGRGQFGDCHVRLRPRERGAGYAFVDSIVGGVIPNKFIPAVDKGIQEAAERGVVAGFPMVDFEAECFDGSYHNVDSSEVAFKIAGSAAFQEAATAADPVLLEPILEVEVTTPDDFVGDVIGDLNQRRGRILGLEPGGHGQIVRAHVPQSELFRYATALRSLTQGRALHTRRLYAFEEVPQAEVARIVEAAGRANTVEAVAR